MAIRALLKWLERLLGRLLLLSAILFGALMSRIPMQERLVCEFDDGDRMVVRQDYWFQPAGLLLRMVNERVDIGKADVFYKPKYWLEEKKRVDWYYEIRDREELCSNFQKKGDLIRTRVMYKLPGMDWQYASSRKMFFNSDLKSLDKKIKEMGLFYGGSGLNIVRVDASTLLYERELTSGKSYPDNIVQAVLQSRSRDNGRTWEPLVLTKESRLYELGKPVHEQKGVARPVDWTGKPWFGGKPKPEASACPKKQAGTDCAGKG